MGMPQKCIISDFVSLMKYYLVDEEDSSVNSFYLIKKMIPMKSFFSVSLFTIAFGVNAQRLNINFFAGASNYQGDIHKKKFTPIQTHFAGRLGFSYDLSDHLFS